MCNIAKDSDLALAHSGLLVRAFDPQDVGLLVRAFDPQDVAFHMEVGDNWLQFFP